MAAWPSAPINPWWEATPEEFIEPYTTAGWEADLSAWQAMAMATTAQEDLVSKAATTCLCTRGCGRAFRWSARPLRT